MTEYVRLGDIISIKKGRKMLESPQTERTVRYIQIEDLRDDNNQKWCEPLINSTIVTVDDVIIAWDGANAGTVGFGLSGAIGSTLARISFKIPINKEYVGQFLRSKFQLLRDKSKGSTIPHVNKEVLENLKIPLPPLEEQKRIAAALDTMSSVIAKRKQQIALLDEAAKSLFVEMFGDPVENPKGWEVVELKELSTKIGSGSTPKGGNQSYVENGISFIRSLNVYNNRFKSKDLAHITPEQAKKLDNVTLQKDDVLINITGASVARSCIVPEDVLPARVNQHVSIIRCIIQKLNPTYLNYLLTDGNYQHILLSVGEAGGATREAITKSQLESLKIQLPPLDLQNLFAARIEALEAQRASCERGLKQMETAFAAMMQEYFG